MVHVHPKLPSPRLATISGFSKSVNLFLFCKFICIISFYIPRIRGVYNISPSLSDLLAQYDISRSIRAAANVIAVISLVVEHRF